MLTPQRRIAAANKRNPTQVNRQGNDVGTQYRSCILAANDAQLAAARASAEKEAARRGLKALATEIELLKCYYRAEEYHQARALRTSGVCPAVRPDARPFACCVRSNTWPRAGATATRKAPPSCATTPSAATAKR